MYEVVVSFKKSYEIGLTPWERSKECYDVRDCMDWAAEFSEEDITWYPEYTDDEGYFIQEGTSERFKYYIQEIEA